VIAQIIGVILVFYDVLQKWCEIKGLSISRLLAELDMSKGSISRWKAGVEPSNRTKKQIADYFGVSVPQFLAGDTAPDIEKAPAEKAEAHDEMNEILQDFRDNPELRALFSLSRKATPEQLKQYANVIKALRGSNDGECDY